MTAIRPFSPGDLGSFLTAAGGEGWVTDPWELPFLLSSFPEGCWSAIRNGDAVGFVTSIKYDKSGWVGNLLVQKELRGQGLGRLLMEKALLSLENEGVDTVWLTASEDGRPLYEKLGFTTVDRIGRWRKSCECGETRRPLPGYSPWVIEEVDRMGWGDRRSIILRGVAERGVVVSSADGFCMVQGAAGLMQVGPWGCRASGAAELLLHEALAAMPAQRADLVLDVPKGNHEAAAILTAIGFCAVGETTLMYRGEKPAYNPGYVYALASMGSMG